MSRPSPAGGSPELRARWLVGIGVAAIAAIAAWWTWRALHDPQGYDLRLAYMGGKVAWATGHPELQPTWTGTPLLAAVMALLTRVISERTAADLLTLLNTTVVVGVIAIVLARIRGLLSPGWWWVTAIALMSFGPMMSTVWWKQFNVIALALALAGFELLRRKRSGPAAALIGLSVAIKPLAFLLPLVLLARRETRRAGALSILWVVALSAAAQGLLAIRAHDLGALSPISAVQNFSHKTQPGYGFACMRLNFSPQTLLCRTVGPGDWGLLHVVVWAGVAALGAWAIHALRGRGATSWELFAFACQLSVMLSPLEWSHYQIVLAPLFVLLLVRFMDQGAPIGAWAGLAGAFVLSSLMLEPYGTWISAVRGLFLAHPPAGVQQLRDAYPVAAVAQFAQYVLLITALWWYSASRSPSRTPRPRATS